MAYIHNFESKRGDKMMVIGVIDWGYNLEWYVHDKNNGQYHNNIGKMPIGVWCMVKSYEYNMFGLWRLV